MEMPCMPPSLTEAEASSMVSLLRTVSYILLLRVESSTPCRRKSLYFFCRRAQEGQNRAAGDARSPQLLSTLLTLVILMRIFSWYTWSCWSMRSVSQVPSRFMVAVYHCWNTNTQLSPARHTPTGSKTNPEMQQMYMNTILMQLLCCHSSVVSQPWCVKNLC